MNLEQICKKTCQLAREVGAFIRQEADQIQADQIRFKGLHDLVTYVDQTAEQKITSRLEEILPEAGFIVEENTISRKGAHYNWIVDPLDGTTNFVHGVPVYAVSIALAYDNQIVLGVVYEINRQECFYAWKQGGAYLNGIKITVSTTHELKHSLLATGFPFTNFTRLEAFTGMLTAAMQCTRGIRRMGSAAVDLAYVACGRFDAFWEYNLKPWDVAAGSLIVEEAGGQVFNFNGEKDFLFRGEIMACNKNLLEPFGSLLKKYFG